MIERKALTFARAKLEHQMNTPVVIGKRNTRSISQVQQQSESMAYLKSNVDNLKHFMLEIPAIKRRVQDRVSQMSHHSHMDSMDESQDAVADTDRVHSQLELAPELE